MAEAVFVWEGTDKQGKKSKGEIKSTNPALAKAELRKQGIVAKKVKKKSKGVSIGGGIKPADIALFTRQMATMMRAGVPLVQAFDIVGDGLDKPKLGALIAQVRTDVAAGNSFANSIRKHPLYFDELFCNLVDAGEQSGALGLRQLERLLRRPLPRARVQVVGVDVAPIARFGPWHVRTLVAQLLQSPPLSGDQPLLGGADRVLPGREGFTRPPLVLEQQRQAASTASASAAKQYLRMAE